ncbi:MAG TPA: Si-specific NAD(P)(+) transhydrogenase [Polyangiaceae bacterium]|nr:Si-specific NAD(P)(+) transhydrogenase [Polyangiaceae bacterium]
MTDAFDLIVIGGGPAGQKAAIQGAKLGRNVLLVERSRSVGGACVRFGTIPSKTLRETALALGKFRRLTSRVMDVKMPEHTQIESLMTRKEEVIASHESYMGAQLARNGIEQAQGVARFLSPHELELSDIAGNKRRVSAPFFVIATGSSPRTPDDVPIDHEHILDSDSILSVSYLPESLTVLGSGVIACEYASIFAALGCKVTIIDRSPRPLAFLDPEISAHFTRQLQLFGGEYLGGRKLTSVAWDGLSMVETKLDDGAVVQSEKLFCALGRIAQVQGLAVEAAGIGLTSRGLIAVDEHGRTAAQHIYAAGDVIGPPALASTSMDQGRRAVCHAFGAEVGAAREATPAGIYTIPELASVGFTEAEVSERLGSALVGRADFREVARGQISAAEDGLLKIVAHPETGVILGVHAAGETAADLVHIGQMAILGGMTYHTFIDAIFNFPTYAEAYRIAALDLFGKRAQRIAAE